MSSGNTKSRRRKARMEQLELDDVDVGQSHHVESPESHASYDPHPEPVKTTKARTMAEILRAEHKAKLAEQAKRKAKLEAPP